MSENGWGDVRNRAKESDGRRNRIDVGDEMERWKIKWGIAQIDKKHKGNKNIQRWQNIYTYIFEIRDFCLRKKNKM